MLFYIIITLIIIESTISTNVGSTIFVNRHSRAECWSADDLAKLKARKIFEQIMPPQVTPDKINSKYIRDALKFFHKALKCVEQDVDIDYHTTMLLKEALADTVGGHLRFEILPTVRYAYYAGYVPYRNVRQYHDFLDEIKTFLNTQGIGWKRPARVPQWSNLTVVKVLIGSGKLKNPCASLVTKRDSKSCIHLPIPKLDDEYNPAAIALPFKKGGLVSLEAPGSENIVLKYYTTAARCILRSSPETCRHTDFVSFNNELWHWMKRDVAPHLADEKLYAAYGGVLRVAAAVQNYGKGLSRRNLFEEHTYDDSKWHPWKALTESYVSINTDWSPKLYIGVVLVIGLAICLLQICYTYIFTTSYGCHCRGRSKISLSKDVLYNNVETSFPAMLPSHPNSDANKQPNPERFTKTKHSSSTSTRTQKVYDLNENTEKMMAVIMSDNESDVESPLPSKLESEEDNVIDVGQSRRQRSPPKLDTPVVQLKIEKTPRTEKKCRMPLYSSSTVTHSEVTYGQERQVSESPWSGSVTSTSGRSISSVTSKCHAKRSRSSRDLAWARRVVSKHSPNVRELKSTSGTEMDLNSFTTPPSQR